MALPAASGANLLLGKGMVFFDRFTTAGVSTGERFLGNCTALEIATTPETKQIYSSASAAAPLLKEALIRQTAEFTVKMGEFTPDNLALVLLGTKGTIEQTSATITDESHLVPAQGVYIKLAYRKLQSTPTDVVVKIGATTKTEGTDYEVDYTSGRIYIIDGGGIAAASTILVTYTYDTITLDKVAAATTGAVEGMLRFVGDPSAGPAYECEVWKISFVPDGSFSLIGDDFLEFTIKGKVLDDSAVHPNDPYYRVFERG